MLAMMVFPYHQKISFDTTKFWFSTITKKISLCVQGTLVILLALACMKIIRQFTIVADYVLHLRIYHSGRLRPADPGLGCGFQFILYVLVLLQNGALK